MRRLGALVLATILLTPAGPASAGVGDDGPVRLRTAYGQGPVHAPEAGQSVLLGFEGRRGDQVTLGTGGEERSSCPDLHLRSGGDAVQRRRDGYWVLPASGPATFRFDPCDDETRPARLQLRLLSVNRLEVDGHPLTTAIRGRGRAHAVEVDVPARGRVQVRALAYNGAPWWGVLPPRGAIHPLNVDRFGESLLFEAGEPVSSTYGVLTRADGTRVRVPPGGGRVRVYLKQAYQVQATSTARIRARGLGDEVSLDVGDAIGREIEVSFRGRAGRWLHPRSTGWPWFAMTLRRPDGSWFAPRSGDVWRLPTTGRYLLRLLVDDNSRTRGSTLRLGTAVPGADLPADGSVTSYQLSEAGQVLVAGVGERPASGAYQLVGAGLPHGTRVSIFNLDPDPCAWWRVGGCPADSGELTAGRPTSSRIDLDSGDRWLVRIRTGAARSGTVELSLQPFTG
jgi:hypothetical protein